MQRLNHITKKLRSFGIIEVLVSGVIVIIVIASVLAVRQRASAQAAFSRHQAVAYMLAQEGIEAVRSIRDTNYIIPQSDGTKFAWDCGLTKQLQLDTTTNTSDYKLTCNDTDYANLNNGDFSLNNTTDTYSSMELGKGMQLGEFFASSGAGSSTPTSWPAWFLSVPNEFDGGNTNGSASSSSSVGNMGADSCIGAERIFVLEGSTPADASGLITKSNNRGVIDANNPADQENYINPLSGSNCESAAAPPGYFEYKRQISVDYGDLKGESAGNIPASWTASDGSSLAKNHMIRVLVRVSWQEESQLVSTEEQAVMLSTYLTDWRSAN